MMENSPVDMEKLMDNLRTSAWSDIPCTLTPKEAMKLRGEILTLKSMVGRLVEDREWISVKDGQPKEPDNYIVAEYWGVYDHTDVRQRTYGGEKYGWCYCKNEDEYERDIRRYKMIAWMPLPEPPESEDE
jgi:hypothetical protein